MQMGLRSLARDDQVAMFLLNCGGTTLYQSWDSHVSSDKVVSCNTTHCSTDCHLFSKKDCCRRALCAHSKKCRLSSIDHCSYHKSSHFSLLPFLFTSVLGLFYHPAPYYMTLLVPQHLSKNLASIIHSKAHLALFASKEHESFLIICEMYVFEGK